MRKVAGSGRALSLLLSLLVGLSLSACTRPSAEIPANAAPAEPAAPAAKAFAKILAVEDSRKFEARPQDPSKPSLQDPAEISNEDLIARAVGRERRADGPGANIFLPAGETVAGAVRAAIEKALRDRGYEVVGEGSPHYDAAATLSVEITQFWIWETQGTYGVSAEFRAAVVATGDVLTEPSTRLESYIADDSAMVIRASHWQPMMQAGIDDLGKKIVAQLKPAPEH